MDELLHSRVEQLKAVEELLDRLEKAAAAGKVITAHELRVVRYFVLDAIAAAEVEHANF